MPILSLTGGASIIYDLGIIIIVATTIALLIRVLKQPPIPAYILTGLILGPLFLGWIKDVAFIHSISEIGIAFLLFLVGLEINLKRLKHVGLASSLGAGIQVFLIYIITFFISIKLGFSTFESMLLGLVLSFSSTMIVIKLLSDSEELDTLNGRIVLGILLIQDIIAILILSMMSPTSSLLSSTGIILSVFRGVVLLIIAMVISKLLLPSLFKFAANSKELLFLSSISVLFLFAFLAQIMNFSIAIGGFIAGLALASFPYNLDIIGKVKPLKDFFATIFFVSLGMQLVLINSSIIKPALIFLAIAIIIKPLVIFLITLFFGFGRRTSFLTGIDLAQLSEFSLILIALPFVTSNISNDVFSMIILIAVITMTLTSYIIKYDEKIYLALSGVLAIFEKLPIKRRKLEYLKRGVKCNIVLIGCHRMGGIFLKALQNQKKRVLVIDNNPDIIRKLMKIKVSCMYGDIANSEILERTKLKKVRIIISTVPNMEDNEFLIDYAKTKNPKLIVLVTANHLHEARELYDMGADYVILPHILSGERLSNMLKKIVKKKKSMEKIRKEHLKHIEGIDLFK